MVHITAYKRLAKMLCEEGVVVFFLFGWCCFVVFVVVLMRVVLFMFCF